MYDDTRTDDTNADAPTERHEDAHATDLTRLQLEQLAAIAWFDRNDEQCHALALETVLTGYHGNSLYLPRVEDNLKNLVERGLVTEHEHDHPVHYELTAHGRELLSDRIQWLAGLLGMDIGDPDWPCDDDEDADGAATVALPDGGHR